MDEQLSDMRYFTEECLGPFRAAPHAPIAELMLAPAFMLETASDLLGQFASDPHQDAVHMVACFFKRNVPLAEIAGVEDDEQIVEDLHDLVARGDWAAVEVFDGGQSPVCCGDLSGDGFQAAIGEDISEDTGPAFPVGQLRSPCQFSFRITSS
jgi:hypothetical protein